MEEGGRYWRRVEESGGECQILEEYDRVEERKHGISCKESKNEEERANYRFTKRELLRMWL